MSKSSEYDFLGVSKDAKYLKQINKNPSDPPETIFFSDVVIKINAILKRQKRNMIISDKAVYNFDGKSMKTRLPFTIFKGLTVGETIDEFIIHCSGNDHDYYFVSQKKKTIIEIMAKNYQNSTGSELNIILFNLKTLENFVTKESDKKQNGNNFSRMPSKKPITIYEYIYGSKIKEDPVRKNIASKPKKIDLSTQANMDDFTYERTLGRGSVGKVLLAKFKKTGDLYVVKNIRKDQIISENLLEYIKMEKHILSTMTCKFILDLSFFFQTPERVYFVTPFMKGGDLYHKLRLEGVFPEEMAKFYAAQLVIALDTLHEKGIAYRDLKPENILIDEDGYIKLCDFSSCISFQGINKERSFAGSPEYASPEMFSREGHNVMTDWWSLGVVLYEMLCGYPAFYNRNQKRMYELCNISEVKFPEKIVINGEEKPLKISEYAKDLIKKLLETDPGKRIGKSGITDFRKHPFFSSINFELIGIKKPKAPFKPQVKMDYIEKNFDEEFLGMDIEDSPVEKWVGAYKNEFKDLD